MRREAEEDSRDSQGSHLCRGLPDPTGTFGSSRNGSSRGGEKRGSIYPTAHVPSHPWFFSGCQKPCISELCINECPVGWLDIPAGHCSGQKEMGQEDFKWGTRGLQHVIHYKLIKQSLS